MVKVISCWSPRETQNPWWCPLWLEDQIRGKGRLQCWARQMLVTGPHAQVPLRRLLTNWSVSKGGRLGAKPACEEQLKKVRMFALETGSCSERNSCYSQIFDELYKAEQSRTAPGLWVLYRSEISHHEELLEALHRLL